MTRRALQRAPLTAGFALFCALFVAGCAGDAEGDEVATFAANSDATTGQGDATSADTTAADTVSSLDDASGPPCVANPKAPGNIGGKRPAKVFVPKSYDGCKKLPLIVLLHGYTATGSVQDAYLGVSARVDKKGFILVLPEGHKNGGGAQFWNATNACCDFANQNPDDAGYLRGLVIEALDKLAVDPERVYFLGHSNGGFMSYRIACESSDLVTGIASIAGAVVKDVSKCTPQRPVNILQIHGTLDPTIGYGGNFAYPGAEAAVKRWAGLNKCSGDAVVGAKLDYDSGVFGSETQPSTWNSCAEKTRVDLWKMAGAGHIPGFNGTYKDEVIDHILAWRRTK